MTKTALRRRLIRDYQVELKIALKRKAEGQRMVDGCAAGTDEPVTIDQYITQWRDGLAALKAGADPEPYDY